MFVSFPATAGSSLISPASSSQLFQIFDDFENGVNSGQPYGMMGWQSISNGTGGSNVPFAPTTSEKNTVGIWRCTTGTGATNFGGLVANVSGNLFGDASITLGYRFRINTLADAVDDFESRFGFSNTWPTIQHGAIFEYKRATSVNWRLITSQSSTATTTTTSTAVDTSWHTIKIVIVNATSVAFYLDGTLMGTHTTNIPTGAAQVCGPVFMSTKTLGTLNRTMDIDWSYMKYQVGTARGTF